MDVRAQLNRKIPVLSSDKPAFNETTIVTVREAEDRMSIDAYARYGTTKWPFCLFGCVGCVFVVFEFLKLEIIAIVHSEIKDVFSIHFRLPVAGW